MVVIEDIPPKPVGRAGLVAMSRGVRDEVALMGAASLGKGAVVAAGSCTSVMVGSLAAEGGTAGWLSPAAVRGLLRDNRDG